MTVATARESLDFEPHAQLISALLPRAAGVTLFAPSGEVRWTSEEAVSPGMSELIKQSVVTSEHSTEGGERAHLTPDDPVYLFWLCDDAGSLLFILAISWRTGESEQRTFSYVYSMAKPVLECMRRELVLRAMLENKGTGTGERDRDLDVLLATSPSSERREGSDEELHHLLHNVTGHMHCEFSALLVPERNLVMVSKAPGRNVDTSVLAKLHRHLLSLVQVRGVPVMLNAPGSLPGVNLPYRVLVSPIRNPAGRASGVLALFRAQRLPEFRERDAQLGDLLARRAAGIIDASYDSLSGLLMRDAFELRASVLLEQRTNARKSLWTALYIDMDRMHVINDNYGMHVGDRLLARMGELIRSRLMPGALAARISGDRFSILLPTGADDAMTFSEALRLGVEALQSAHLSADVNSKIKVSISVGVAAITDPRVDFAHAFAVAETACKAAKDRGRNRVELYQASDVSIMRRYEDMNIAPGLRAAISENRLRLDAQLIMPLTASRKVSPHFELLLRMIDEQGGVVGPDRFMSAAVRYQLMPEVDRWVIREAIRVLTPQAALLANRAVAFAINVSGQSLGDAEFADFVIDEIRGSGINPKVFCFELTESAAIANLARAETVMTRLRELGCTVALDDFGTGLSSLAYLRALPVDMLKIDGSFVRDILKDSRAESMVQAIAQLARSMNLQTVAEYVETDAIRQRVARLGVDYGQGFAIARPAPLSKIIADLPAYIAGPQRQSSDDAIPELIQDTITTKMPEDVFGDDFAVESDDDSQRRIERMLEGYDHSESTLYQRKRGA
jgi:diguanylate cyclase (GGDEF)-like protein